MNAPGLALQYAKHSLAGLSTTDGILRSTPCVQVALDQVAARIAVRREMRTVDHPGSFAGAAILRFIEEGA
jgi:hypothetical protein